MRISAISGWSPLRGTLGQTSLNLSTDMMVGLALGAIGMIFYLRKQQAGAR